MALQVIYVMDSRSKHTLPPSLIAASLKLIGIHSPSVTVNTPSPSSIVFEISYVVVAILLAPVPTKD